MFTFIPKNTNIDFQKPRRMWMTISGLIILAGIISLIWKGGPSYGIDFEGGLALTLRFNIPAGAPPITEENMRRTLDVAGMSNSEVKMSRSTEGEDLLIHIKEEGRYRPPESLIRAKLDEQYQGTWRQVPQEMISANTLSTLTGRSYVAISTDVPKGDLDKLLKTVAIDNPEVIAVTTATGETAYILAGEGHDSVSRLKKAIAKDYPNYGVDFRSIDRVGPRIGQELRSKSIWAMLATLGLIIIYLWYRFEFLFGVAAVVALFHDVLITLGLFSFFNFEISITVVGAFLTLVGYSLNDTIVVYDRIRENFKRYKEKPFGEVVNISINQTLSRTVITSGVTMLVVVVLYFMGGEVLHNFAFVLLAGIIVGTYSSIFIASPILVEYSERTGKTVGKKQAK